MNSPHPRAAWSLPRESRTLRTADGVDIFATLRGHGEAAVVIAHGFTGGHRHGSFSRLLGWFERHFTVIAIDQRGHGASGGTCTLAHFEPMDVDAAVAWARELGFQQVATVGFSMGASSVLRQAALANTEQRQQFDQGITVRHRPDAVVVVGSAAQWFFRGSAKMLGLHLLVATRLGLRWLQRREQTRVDLTTWPAENLPGRAEVQPLDPQDSIMALAPVPVLIVHGTEDDYFPLDHGQRLYAAASSVPGHNAELWVEQGMGHAENATGPELVDRIAGWLQRALLPSRTGGTSA